MHDNITLVATITARQGAREKVLLALKTVEHDVQGETRVFTVSVEHEP